METLALLRKYASAKRFVGENGDQLVFGNLACSKSAGTNMKWLGIRC